MNSNPNWLLLTSVSYFTCWFILIVVYHLSGWAQVSGAVISLWAFANILSAISISFSREL
ncbi:MAG: hypothetical protein ABUT20_03520 [Bacteroidota bacterium]